MLLPKCDFCMPERGLHRFNLPLHVLELCLQSSPLRLAASALGLVLVTGFNRCIQLFLKPRQPLLALHDVSLAHLRPYRPYGVKVGGEGAWNVTSLRRIVVGAEFR